jgi:hypothetical protein
MPTIICGRLGDSKCREEPKMKRAADTVLCGFMISLALSSSLVAQAPQSQAALSERLLSEDAGERSDALEAIRRIGVAQTSQDVRSALIRSLQQEAMLHRRRDVADRGGENLPPLDDPELLTRLASTVGELRDPASIPALAAALGSGFVVIRPLAAFGERAVPAILEVESTPDSGTGAVNHALITLRFIVQGASAGSGLSDRTLAELRRVAARRLGNGEGSATTTLWWAIDLAWVVQDTDLRQSVEALATDPNVVIARGITDPGLIEQTQRRAADRIAAIPPLPRP